MNKSKCGSYSFAKSRERYWLCIALLLNVTLATSLPSKKGADEDSLQSMAPSAGTQIAGIPVVPVASAVVNFEELARQDASKSSQGPTVAIAIHSPVTPPESELSSAPAPPLAALPPKAVAPSVPSPSPTLNFAGLDDIAKVGGTTIVIPPDTDGAVGLTKVMVGLNNNYRIQDKMNGNTLSTVSIDTFWSASGGAGFFDPKTLYDPINNRWIVTVLSNAASANSSVEIGVSQTSDPSGSYHIFRIDADAGDTTWADFPCIGFNKNWVAVNVNMFNNSNNMYANSKMLVVDYAQLRGGMFSGSFVTGTGFCTSPSATYSATESTLYAPTHLSSAGGTYRLDTITGTPSAPVYTVGATKSRGLTWTAPNGNILPQAAPLAGTSACSPSVCKAETQDAFIRSTPVVREGALYYAQTVGLPAGGLTRTGVQWTKLDATGGMNTGNVLDGGRVEDPMATDTNGGKWYAYPHIAVNQHGDIILGFSQFSSSQHPAAGYTVHARTDGAGVMRDPVTYKAGEDYYNKDFGSGRNRWGDYSKAQVDPSNDSDLWVLNEYAKARVGTDDGGTGSNSSRWGTWWAKVAFSSTDATMSTLSAELQDQGVRVRWRTGMEVRNLGFNVYRDEGSSLTRVNPSVLAGSALVAGSETPLLAGFSYSWHDPDGKPDSRYWVEDLTLTGEGTWHGPVLPDRVPLTDEALYAATARTLDGLGTGGRLRDMTSAPGVILPTDTPFRLSRQSALAAGPAIKLLVREAGWYRIPQTDLLAAGLHPGTDPRNLSLYVDGLEVPILVRGEQDGRFDASDSVEFYGVGLDIPSTDRRVYWLVSGSGRGRRIISAGGVSRSAPVRGFPHTIETRERTIYVSSVQNGDDENFYSAVISTTPVEQNLTLHHLDSSENLPVVFEVVLQGMTQAPHRVKVWLNETDIGEIVFDAQERGRGRFSVPSTQLQNVNRMRLVALGGKTDVTLLESIRATYRHSFTADNQTLRFPLTAGQTASIEGFGTPSIRVLDVTDPDDVTEVEREVQPQGPGFAVKVAPSGRGLRTLLAFDERQALKPEAIVTNQPSTWRRPGNAADLVIISHRAFLKNLEPLRALRQGDGLATVIVDIDDVYDEFSYGHKTPEAIREFLRFADGTWQKPPRYVLLVGDAVFDPRNHLGKGGIDFVPTRFIDTGNMETASDDWFVDIEGTGRAKMAIGRLPVRTGEEADVMISKILRYEASGSQGGALLVTDVSDTYDFKRPNADLRALASRSMPVEEILRGAPEVGFNRKLLDSLNRGHKIVNYMGHGSVDVWRADFLTSAEARGLSNAQNLPIFIAVTCLNGYFVNPALESLGEALLRADRGGAAAVWTSTGVTDAEPQAKVNVELFEMLFNAVKSSGSPLTIGEATSIAKYSVKDREIQRTYILLGDPSMKVR